MGTPPSEHRVRANGIELAYFEWGAPVAGQPSLLFAHATGFHARVFDSVIRRLGERHVISLDQRGHGRSEKPAITHWQPFGADLAVLVKALDLHDLVGVGHSMGGHAMVEAAAASVGRFLRLVVIDPVIASPDDYGEGGWSIEGLGGMQHPVAKRKSRFASPHAMFERFADREPYVVFERDALRDYCQYGLLPADDGDGFVLACPPQIEASIYMTSRSNPVVYESVRRLAIPVLILRAKAPPADRTVMDFSSSPTWPGLVGEFKRGREVHLAEHTHFLPMEIPERVAALIGQELDAI